MFVSSPSFGLSGSYLRVTKSPYVGTLVSGSYADTLTVTVSPAS
jgi:spore coat protein U-like protein